MPTEAELRKIFRELRSRASLAACDDNASSEEVAMKDAEEDQA